MMLMSLLNSLIQFFVPKDKKFFPLFEQDTRNLVKISEALLGLVDSKNPEERTARITEIEQLEHLGDNITHEIKLELSRNFITPFDREDIHELASAIDDVADFINASAHDVSKYKITHFGADIQILASLINQAAVELEKAITELKSMSNSDTIKTACVNINSIENRADQVFHRLIQDLFDHEKDPIAIIKMKEFAESLEAATDKCEDAANVIETIVVKYA